MPRVAGITTPNEWAGNPRGGRALHGSWGSLLHALTCLCRGTRVFTVTPAVAGPAGRDLGRGPRCVPRRRRQEARRWRFRRWRFRRWRFRRVVVPLSWAGRSSRPCARRASRTPWEMLCHRWSSPSSEISPERRSALRTGHITRTRKRSTSRRRRAARRSARASALVVSIWLVASMSSTRARVPGVESIRARMLSLAGRRGDPEERHVEAKHDHPGIRRALSVVADAPPGRLLMRAPCPSPRRRPWWSGRPGRSPIRPRPAAGRSGGRRPARPPQR